MVKTVDYTYHDPKVNSSAISEIWYSSTTRELFVKFRDSEQVAGYSDVSPVAADRLVESASVGGYYAKFVKPNYKGINTKDVEFRAAPGLAKKTTTPKAAPGSYTAAQTLANKKPTPLPTKKNQFTITGRVLKPQTVTDYVMAETLDEAIAIFKASHAGESTVTKAEVKFE